MGITPIFIKPGAIRRATTMTDKSLAEALKEYELIYMPSRNWAQKTRVNYRTDIADLLRFLEELGKTDPTGVDLQDLEAYVAELDRRGYTGTTRRRKTSSIKSFFGFLEQYGYTNNNIAERLRPPEREHKEPRVLSKREYQEIIRKFIQENRKEYELFVNQRRGVVS